MHSLSPRCASRSLNRSRRTKCFAYHSEESIDWSTVISKWFRTKFRLPFVFLSTRPEIERDRSAALYRVCGELRNWSDEKLLIYLSVGRTGDLRLRFNSYPVSPPPFFFYPARLVAVFVRAKTSANIIRSIVDNAPGGNEKNFNAGDATVSVDAA